MSGPIRIEVATELENAVRELRSIIKQEDFMKVMFEKDEFGNSKILDVSKLVENEIYNEAIQKVGQGVVDQTKLAVRQQYPEDEIRWRANVLRHRFGSIAGYLSALLPIVEEADAQRTQLVFRAMSHSQAQRPVTVAPSEGRPEIYLFEKGTSISVHNGELIYVLVRFDKKKTEQQTSPNVIKE